MARPVRLLAGFLALVSMAAWQFAFSAHACEKMADESAGMERAARSQDGHASPGLCLEHCRGAKAFPHPSKAPFAAPASPAAMLRAVQIDSFTAAARIASRRVHPPPEPPPTILFGVLRL